MKRRKQTTIGATAANATSPIRVYCQRNLVGMFLGLLCLVWQLLSLPALLADEPDLPDYATQLPSTPSKDVDASLREFQIEPGLRCLPLASEPTVVDPIAIAFDADGAMFVVEMRGYSEDEELNLGRIRKLVDRDDDGRFETSTVFADGLSWPTAVTCFDGGILVAVAPDLVYLKDSDGDGRADVRQVWFTGFHRSNVQGLVNSLQWGLDNRIHGATSSSGASLRRPGDPEELKLELRGRDFAIDPRSQSLAATSGGGQHGMSFNRWGEKFACQNSSHVQQLIYEDRYLSRNPYVAPPPSRISIAADGPQADVFRTSPVEAWRVIRTKLRVSGRVPGPVERGGKAAGYFTGATGVLAFRGDRWPTQFLDYLFVCDVGSNLVHRKRLRDLGIQYSAERVDEKHEFLTSSDIWFRPVQLANGPEGVLYVIDMHREVVEHPASLPPAIKRHLDLTNGRDRGRIYAVVPSEFKHRSQPSLSQLPTVELVDYLQHSNGWHRQAAARLLYERNDPTAVDAVRGLLRHSPLAEGRLRALYALASLEMLNTQDLLLSFQDADAHVRRHAVRLAEAQVGDEPQLANAMLALVDDPSPKVQYQLAFSLASVRDHGGRQQALQQLAFQNADNRYIVAAVQNSLADGVAELLTYLIKSPEFQRQPVAIAFLRDLADQVRRQQLPSERTAIVNLVVECAEQQPLLMMSVLPRLALPATTELATVLRQGAARTIVDRLLARARTMSLDQQQDSESRLAAIAMLAMDDADRAAPLYEQLLVPSQPLPIQRAAIESLGQHAAPEIARVLLQAWDTYTPAVREDVANSLSMRSSWQDLLIEALEAGDVRLGELSASQRQRLEQRATDATWARIQSTAGIDLQHEDQKQLFARYQDALKGDSDIDAGRRVFRKVCAACHRVEYFGHSIAPSLTAMKNRGPDSILVNVLDPNREVNPQYLAYTAALVDGRVVSGMIRSETATSIELLEAENRAHTLLRVEIDELVNTRRSLMPTGMEKQVSPQEMADLIGYLLTVDQ